MHQTESDELSQCADCGAEVSPGRDRAYAYDAENVICFECATRRGGGWDALHERWEKAPDLSGLVDSRRPHD